VVAAIVDGAIASTALGALMAWYRVPIGTTAIWGLVAFLIMALWLIGTGLLLSAVQVRHRDVGLAIPVVLQVWMFATPVVYPLSLARGKLSPALYALYTLNPMAAVVDTFRRGVVLHLAPDPTALLEAALVTIVLLPIAYLYFKYAELTMADAV
jgi:lipopolysaccharide transport system permease protein